MSLNKAGRKILKRLTRLYTNKGTRCNGGRYLYLNCPFHQERTASWCIDKKTGRHYCFGCHQRGDIWQIARKQPEVLGRRKIRKSDPVFPYPLFFNSSFLEDKEIPF